MGSGALVECEAAAVNIEDSAAEEGALGDPDDRAGPQTELSSTQVSRIDSEGDDARLLLHWPRAELHTPRLGMANQCFEGP